MRAPSLDASIARLPRPTPYMPLQIIHVLGTHRCNASICPVPRLERRGSPHAIFTRCASYCRSPGTSPRDSARHIRAWSRRAFRHESGLKKRRGVAAVRRRSACLALASPVTVHFNDVPLSKHRLVHRVRIHHGVARRRTYINTTQSSRIIPIIHAA